MAITSGFFDSKNGDRKYNTTDWSSMFEGMFADGVFKTIGENFAPKAGSGMQINIGTGKAWFDKAFIKNSALYQVSINQSDVLLDRIDAIVIEINHTEQVRQGTIKYIAGSPASSPSKPALTKSEQINQYPILYVTVPHGSTSISQSNIEVMVGKSECPFAVGLLEGIDIDYMFSQWDAQFNEWFDKMKDQLSTDAAGNLQVQIDNIIGVDAVVSISTSDWSSKSYTYRNPLITANSKLYWQPPIYDGNDSVIDAIQASNLQDGGVYEGYSIIKCKFDVPNTTIQLRVNITNPNASALLSMMSMPIELNDQIQQKAQFKPTVIKI